MAPDKHEPPVLRRFLDAQQHLAVEQAKLDQARLRVQAAEQEHMDAKQALDAAVRPVDTRARRDEPAQRRRREQANEIKKASGAQDAEHAEKGKRAASSRKKRWTPGEPLHASFIEVLRLIPTAGEIRFVDLLGRLGLADHVLRARVGKLKQCGLLISASWGTYALTDAAKAALREAVCAAEETGPSGTPQVELVLRPGPRARDFS